MDIIELNKLSSQIKKYCDKTLSEKFSIPVLIDDSVCRVIASAVIMKGVGKVWVKGNQENLKDLQLRLSIVYQQKENKH